MIKILCGRDLIGKKSKRFSIFEFRLVIKFSLFRLQHFGKVGSRLGPPKAGVEIGTGIKRELFYTFWNKAKCCRTNTLSYEFISICEWNLNQNSKTNSDIVN